MPAALILASGSEARQTLLTNAGVVYRSEIPRIDEQNITAALLAEGTTPRDIADRLAEMKATKIAAKHPADWVIGCDQTGDFDGHLMGKPDSPEQAADRLWAMRGKRHSLYSAVVVYHDNAPVWRHIGQVRLTMRAFSRDFLDAYVDRNWDAIRHCAGAYQLEHEGVRLFSRVEGDYFTVLGLPLVELLSYLTLRGVLEE